MNWLTWTDPQPWDRRLIIIIMPSSPSSLKTGGSRGIYIETFPSSCCSFLRLESAPPEQRSPSFQSSTRSPHPLPRLLFVLVLRVPVGHDHTQPFVKLLPSKFGGAVAVATVDVDEASEIADERSVTSIPHFVLLKDGLQVFMYTFVLYRIS